MIEKLYIKNYLIIKEAEINFSPGLNILTGETGAGKTIIIDALSLILGERADYSLLKKDENRLVVEGHFSLKDPNSINEILDEIEIEENQSGYLIIRRELSKKGISRNFINDTPVNISDLKRLGDIIIDIHSQNEHQSLLSKDTHAAILDNFSGKNEYYSKYNVNYIGLTSLINEYNALKSRKTELSEKREYLEFQLKEINNLNPSLSEDEDLETELKKLENVEDISLALNNSINALYEGDQNALSLLSISMKELKKISDYDKDVLKIIGDLENALILIKESSESMMGNLNLLNFDPVRIEQIRKRLSDINFLKKKYNLPVIDLIKKAGDLENELNLIENFDRELEMLNNKISDKRKEAFQSAEKLSVLRKSYAKELSKTVNKVLHEVGLESAEFSVEFKPLAGSQDDLKSVKRKNEILKLTSNGFDGIEFLIKVNKGSDFTSLRKSASGGEISRIMLAVKTALSEKDKIPVLVFDEIDAGISGRIAQKVGKIMKNLAKSHQLICITHLPQIAAMSEKHFYVSKKESKDYTTAEIKELNKDEKVLEIAKLLSGEKLTEAATKSARELINS
jgi:DNA repair protein RecN (Recombination protein N)